MAREHYDELLWDYLYGLLDPAEAVEVRAHVEACAPCRTALAEAESQQQMLARAARVIRAVPAFSVPGQDQPVEAPAPEAATAPSPVEPAPAAATVPLAARAPRRSPWRRYWPAWTAAAALLGVAFGLNEAYRSELAQLESEAARARKQVKAVDTEFAALRADVDRKKQDTARQLLAQVPQIQALGPTHVHPGTPANVRVTARDQTGKPTSAEIKTSLVDPASGRVLHQQTDEIRGEGQIQVPVKGLANLVMEAPAAKGDAKITETLHAAEPVHASHVVLNKSLYFVGEVLFFRTLTLDRYTLKPPAHALPLHFALLDASGRTVKELPGQTGPGGISGGELALTPDLAGGNYTLRVTAADGSDLILPQSRSVEIVREEPPHFAFDRSQYKGGDTLNYNFRGGQQAGNNPINITLNNDGQPVPQEANKTPGAVQGRADNQGNLNGQLQLPPQVRNPAIVAEFQDKKGKEKKVVVQPVPVVPSERAVDFFPEGGDLVAGVSNRVYYRVRSPEGEPLEPEGHVIVLASKEVLHDSERQQGVGSFTFVPDAKETYSVRVTGSGPMTEIKKPFEKLGIKSEGLVLSAPQSVSGEGEPLAVVLRNQGPDRRVLLQTTCRGQIVDQQYLDVKPGSREVKLQPAPGANGVLRVTAFDASGNGFVPLAERLLFRIPANRLDVSCRIVNGPGPYPAGTHLRMTMKGTDEQQNAGPLWILAAVVDEKYRAEKNERSLADHFFLASDVGGAELDQANLVVKDTPASRQALDLFLGTHGWRRFVVGEGAALVAKAMGPAPDAAKEAKAKDAALVRASLFSRQNATPQKLQEQYQADLQKEVSELIDQANQERADLIAKKELGVQVLGQASGELARYRQLPREYFRIGLGVLALGLLIAGAVFLSVGLVRLVRKKEESPTACFAGAFSCLFACLILYLVAGRMPGVEILRGVTVTALDDGWPPFGAEMPAAAKQDTPTPLTSLPQGYIVAQSPPVFEEQKADKRLRTPAPTAPTADMLAKLTEASLGRSLTYSANWTQNAAPSDIQRQLQDTMQVNEELRRRYAVAASKTKEQTNPAPTPPQSLPQSKKADPEAPFGGTGGAKRSEEKEKAQADAVNYFREYAHRMPRQGSRRDFQDTLLWYPALYSADGTADVSFDLSQNLSNYRILLYANSPSGRLGFYEGNLEVRAK